MNITGQWDPNAVDDKDDLEKEYSYVHLRVQKRNNRKYWTIVEGLDSEVDLKKLIKKLKETLSCGGSITNGVITMQGDQRQRIKEILVEKKIVEAKHVVVHGF